MFYLMTMKAETDRVFLCCPKDKCIEQVEADTHIVRVNHAISGNGNQKT